MNKLSLEPIAYIKNDFKEKFGIPRQSGRSPSTLSKIIFYPKYRNPDALRGLLDFNYLWLIFDFSLSHTDTFSPTVRPPRLGGNEKVGVFASRSPFRPNPLGLSSVKLLKIENDTELIVSGADLLDGTPIYDIKPYLPSSDCHTDAIGGFADVHNDYKLKVNFPAKLLKLIAVEKQNGLLECLSDDPRPSYIDDDDRVYGMKYADYNVKFMVSEKILTVIEIETV